MSNRHLDITPVTEATTYPDRASLERDSAIVRAGRRHYPDMTDSEYVEMVAAFRRRIYGGSTDENIV